MKALLDLLDVPFHFSGMLIICSCDNVDSGKNIWLKTFDFAIGNASSDVEPV